MKTFFQAIFFSITCLWSMPSKAGIAALYVGERPTSEPYVSGDTFRKYCDHVIDIKSPCFDPIQVKKGDTIFVAPLDMSAVPAAFVEKFFRDYAPLIKVPYVLVTHNSDLNITEQFRHYLDNENLIAWFAQNVGFSHPKLKNLPIGLENELWGRHYVDILNRIQSSGKSAEKKYLLYMNFSTGTNPSVRKPAYDYFKDKDFCHVTGRMSVESYLWDVVHAKFVVSPHGNGLDCHRTWEALYLGVIPIVKTSTLDPLYEDLPVLIVDDWSEVTREFLETQYTQIMSKAYKKEKLFMPYWQRLWVSYKDVCNQ